MGKFDFKSTVAKLQKAYAKDEYRMKQFGIGDALGEISQDPKDYVVMPDWWKENYGVMGLPFGDWIEISGNPDAGKTSLALLAMKCAQEQGFGILYVETENKTNKNDLIEAGIDPEGMLTVKTRITEEMYDGITTSLDAFFDDYPEEKLLLVIDSFGNTVSMRDAKIDMTKDSQKVGGEAKSNRTGLSQICVKQARASIATLLVNYSYANIGSRGATNSGGKALDYFSMLILSAARIGWYERTVGGVKVRIGADVKWTVIKNHYTKSLREENGDKIYFPKSQILRITEEGIKPLKKV